MTEIFVMKLDEIQPCQLFINSEKLARVLRDFDRLRPDSFAPVPVKSLEGRIIITDGHTRALAAFLRGFLEVRVVWEVEDLDWEAYGVCVGWCRGEGVFRVADLEGRVVSPEEFEVLWVERCRRMAEGLESRRDRE